MDVKKATDSYVDFEKCILCQHQTKEKLINPSKCTRTSEEGKSYGNIAESLKEFEKLNYLESSSLRSVVTEYWDGLGPYLQVNRAKWHKKCRLKFNG